MGESEHLCFDECGAARHRVWLQCRERLAACDPREGAGAVIQAVLAAFQGLGGRFALDAPAGVDEDDRVALGRDGHERARLEGEEFRWGAAGDLIGVVLVESEAVCQLGEEMAEVVLVVCGVGSYRPPELGWVGFESAEEDVEARDGAREVLARDCA